MYNDIVAKKRSYNYFRDAIQSTNEEHDSKFFEDGLNIIGVHYKAPNILSDKVLAEPMVDISFEKKKTFGIDVVLKPELGEEYSISLLDTTLRSLGIGEVYNNPQEDIMQENSGIADFFVPKALEANKTDQVVTTTFNKEDIKLRTFRLFEKTYYAFELTYEKDIAGEPVQQIMTVLFKDKESTSETLFSALIGKKLGRREVNRVLESVSERNITGMFVGGATYKGRYSVISSLSLTPSVLSWSSPILTYFSEETTITTNINRMDFGEIKVDSGGGYTLRIHFLNGDQLNILIG